MYSEALKSANSILDALGGNVYFKILSLIALIAWVRAVAIWVYKKAKAFRDKNYKWVFGFKLWSVYILGGLVIPALIVYLTWGHFFTYWWWILNIFALTLLLLGIFYFSTIMFAISVSKLIIGIFERMAFGMKKEKIKRKEPQNPI